MKTIIVKFTFDEAWEECCPDDSLKIHDIIDPQQDGVEYEILKRPYTGKDIDDAYDRGFRKGIRNNLLNK